MTAVVLVATLAVSPAPGPGLVPAVRMASVVQWNAGYEWNQAVAAGEGLHSFRARNGTDPALRVSGGSGGDPSPVTSSSLAKIRDCESGGDYTAVSSNGMYRGAYQFSRSTWKSVGGIGDPAAASPEEQDARAEILYDRRGPAPWPVCGR